jgi:L-phenylalanine/L-methionine N-acetyltransferase
MALTSERLQIRPLMPHDAEGLYAIVSTPQVARTLVQLPSMELAETLEWMEKKVPGRHTLVAEVDGRIAGSVSVTHFQNPRLAHTGRLGIMLHRDFWRQGVGSRLMQAILDIADNWLNLKRIELDVFTTNVAAIRLYEKFGFESEGVRRCATFGDGRWLDDVLMARLRRVEPQRSQEGKSTLSHPAAKPNIEPGDLLIRPLHPDDLADLHQLWAHPLVDRTTMQLPSMTYAAVAERVNSRRPGLYRYVAETGGRVVGMIALHQSQNPRLVHSAGLGMMVHPDFWGVGVGSALMRQMIDLADNWLNLKRVELDVNTDNPAGLRLYDKFGFVIEGTRRMHVYGDGRWADSHFMARIRR